MAKYQSTHTGAQIDEGIDLLGSNSATKGQVLTANGTGGASWQDVDNRFRYTHFIKITYVDGDFVAVTGIITYVSNSSTPLTSFMELPPEVELPFHGRYSYMDAYSVQNIDGNIFRIMYFDYQQGESINVSWADMSELTTFEDTVL